MNKRIAVLITCHNRKSKTIKCLEALFDADFCGMNLSVYLVDDGSTDGTRELVEKIFPSVNIIAGSGSLFWSRGMFSAWSAAVVNNYDYYLWLNDDVRLHRESIRVLMSDIDAIGDGNGVVSGKIEDESCLGSVIYGGSSKSGAIVKDNVVPVDVINMNGNAVLVSKNICDKVGIIDPFYWHDLGDVDYGYRVRLHGFRVVVSSQIVGSCSVNKICRVRKPGVGVIDRFRNLYSPLGSPPRIAFYFRRRHFGFFSALVHAFYTHFINLIPDFIAFALFGGRYFPHYSAPQIKNKDIR